MPHEDILGFFARYIEAELGIVYADHNYFQLQNRLEEISKLIGAADLPALHATAEKGITGDFRKLLLDTATNNETSFFRDAKVFRALESHLRRPEGRSAPMRIWSAASSTGQEALSLAMTIRELGEDGPSAYSITGTDISERALTKARSATYSQLEVQRGLSAKLLVKYFTKNERDEWTACPLLTSNTTFQSMNLKAPFPFRQPFDIVLCRNVLIYQKVESKKEILLRIAAALSPGGLLVLGSGESLIGLLDNFELDTIDGAILYRKKLSSQKAA
jgi:chemotaxis protein methyltransferase CheR